MKTKLGYLCSSESWGGLEMNHLRNANWMQERGHNVVVLCIEGSPIEKNARELNLNVLPIAKHKKYYDFKNARKLRGIITENNISHLLIRSTYDMSILASVKRKMDSKLHTSYFMEMQLGVKKTNLLHSLRFNYIDVWSCPLDWLSDQVQQWTKFNNQLVVIPSGLDLSQFNNIPTASEARSILEIPTDKITFGLIGRFDRQKGQLLLLEAMNKCENRDFNLVFLGEPTLHEGDDYFNQMKAFIRSHQLEDRVFIRPYRKDTAVFYSAIDWLVMATKAETYGMVTIESLACGTPVLGSNAGGTPEILKVNEGGMLFNSMDAIDLANKIDLICGDKVTYSADKLKSMANHYDHQKVCEMIEKTLNL